MTPARIVWFRDDLRLSDHPALHAAAEPHAPVDLPLRAGRQRAPGVRPLGGAARWWLAQSLRALQASLRKRGRVAGAAQGGGGRGHRRRSRARSVPSAVYLERDRAGAAQAVADQVAAALAEIGVAAHRFPGDLLVAPSQIRNKENRGLRVFTPFWRRVQSLGDPPKPLPAPKKLSGVPDLAGDALEDWQLEPTQPDWAGGLRETWTARRSFGAGAAQGVPRRAASPAIPAIATGPTATAPRGCRRICASARSVRARSGTPRALPRPSTLACPADIEKFLSELGWREFCRHLLFDVPDLATRNLQPSFDAFPWKHDAKALARLAARPDRLSHRRCRHARTLAHRRDAQPGADGGGLVPGQASPDRLARRRAMVLGHAGRCRCRQQPGQLAMGRGLAAPTPRPISASSIRSCRARSSIPTASMSGAGCRSWRNCPTSLIHQPWTATPLELASAGIELGKTYPQPIVDHKAGRERALAAYASDPQWLNHPQAVRRLTRNTAAAHATMPAIAMASSRSSNST